MSRIHEAMRRAAEAASDGTQAAAVEQEAGDISELAGESFPIELNSSRRVRSATLVNDAWQGQRSALAAALQAELRSGDAVFTLGAGDITGAGRELLQRMSTDR
jgi:UDP-N-acetylmuramate-alanine ligase